MFWKRVLKSLEMTYLIGNFENKFQRKYALYLKMTINNKNKKLMIK